MSFRTGDFKSPASAIPPLARVLKTKDIRYHGCVAPANWAQMRTRADSFGHVVSRVQIGPYALGDLGDLAGVVFLDDSDGAPSAKGLDGGLVNSGPLCRR